MLYGSITKPDSKLETKLGIYSTLDIIGKSPKFSNYNKLTGKSSCVEIRIPILACLIYNLYLFLSCNKKYCFLFLLLDTFFYLAYWLKSYLVSCIKKLHATI